MEKNLAFLVFHQDIAHYLEGESEGSAFCFGIVAKKKPTLESWFRFTSLVEDTLGLQRNFVEEIGDMPKHIDKVSMDEGFCYFDNYAVADWESGKTFNYKREVVEAFTGNTVYLRIVGIGGMKEFENVREDYNPDVVSDGPLELEIPLKMKVYRFIEYGDRVDQINDKVIEMKRLCD